MVAGPETERNSGPEHIAIIMDGNGRWATSRGLPRLEGHRRGVETTQRIVEAAVELEVGYLTLYSFSTENWRRPAAEVQGLMQLFRLYVESNLDRLHRGNVRVQMIGGRERVAKDILVWIDRASSLTRGNTGLTLTIAFNYGSRLEMLQAARAAIADAAAGRLGLDEITPEAIAQRLQSAALPNPDLLVRTSGELRLSNYLLWQLADRRMYFTETLWPDFDKADLEKAIVWWRAAEARDALA